MGPHQSPLLRFYKWLEFAVARAEDEWQGREPTYSYTLSSVLVDEENRNGGEAPERKMAMASF